MNDAPIPVTPQGHQKITAELERLWKEERPRVTAEVEAAAALGDRSRECRISIWQAAAARDR